MIRLPTEAEPVVMVCGESSEYHAIGQKRVADYMSAGPMFANVEKQANLFTSQETS